MRNETAVSATHGPQTQASKRDNGSAGNGRGPSPEKTSGRAPLAGVPVLIIEDDIPSARLSGFLLHEAGAEVRVVHSAEQALVAMETFTPRVLVLDLILPRMSGLLLLQQLKAEPSTRDLIVVAVTSMNGPEAERMVLAAGCSAYIRKPIDVNTFAANVARTVDGQP